MEGLLQMTGTFMEGKVILAGAELGVFDLLKGVGKTARQVAEDISGDLRGVEVLLDALVSLGILMKKNGIYRNLPEYEPHLVSGGDGHRLLRHRNRIFRSWATLEERVLGRPLPEPVEDTPRWKDAPAMGGVVRAVRGADDTCVKLLADQIDLGPIGTLAGLGSDAARYLAEFARRKAALNPCLFDPSVGLPDAAETPRDARVAVRPIAWDYFASDPPADLPRFDMVFVASALHVESPEQNQKLLRRLHALVVPNGELAIQENAVNEDHTWPVEGALFAVNMVAWTPNGRTYADREIVDWAEAAGFARKSVRRLSPCSCLLRFKRRD